MTGKIVVYNKIEVQEKVATEGDMVKHIAQRPFGAAFRLTHDQVALFVKNRIGHIVSGGNGTTEHSLSKDYSSEISSIERLDAGINDVFLIQFENDLKIVVKFIDGRFLADKIWFYTEANKKSVLLPRILHTERIEPGNACKFLEHIPGSHFDSESKSQTDTLVLALRRLHSVRLNGFGENLAATHSTAAFRFDSGVDFIRNNLKNIRSMDSLSREISYLFEYIDSRIGGIEFVACMVHGDLRPQNLIVRDDEIFIIDPGLIRAFDPSWDIAYWEWSLGKEHSELRRAYEEGGKFGKKFLITKAFIALQKFSWGLDNNKDMSGYAERVNHICSEIRRA